jgi:hypothetical protein
MVGMNIDPVSIAIGAIAGVALMGLAWLAVGRKPAAAPVPQPAIEPKPMPKVEKPSGAPLRLLALMQAESRFIDFLMEDIAAFNDAQIGQAVRDIHRKAQAVLKQHLVMEPVVPVAEGDAVTIPKGFDPSAIRILGNVTGEPPYSGTVQHPGWRVKELKLNPPPRGADDLILQAAEVQIG